MRGKRTPQPRPHPDLPPQLPELRAGKGAVLNRKPVAVGHGSPRGPPLHALSRGPRSGPSEGRAGTAGEWSRGRSQGIGAPETPARLWKALGRGRGWSRGSSEEAVGPLAAGGAETPEGGTVTATPLPGRSPAAGRQAPALAGTRAHRHACGLHTLTQTRAHTSSTVGGGRAPLPARKESYVSAVMSASSRLVPEPPRPDGDSFTVIRTQDASVGAGGPTHVAPPGAS